MGRYRYFKSVLVRHFTQNIFHFPLSILNIVPAEDHRQPIYSSFSQNSSSMVDYQQVYVWLPIRAFNMKFHVSKYHNFKTDRWQKEHNRQKFARGARTLWCNENSWPRDMLTCFRPPISSLTEFGISLGECSKLCVHAGEFYNILNTNSIPLQMEVRVL